jgi:gliding motility-associated-like protein
MIFNIVVEECGCEYVIPNVFTPNGDNSNDVFEITTSPTCDFNTFEILIFNRWGKLLWSSSDPTEVWNGNNGNTLCPEGVYFWTMKYSRQEPNKEAENVSENGTITLIR